MGHLQHLKQSLDCNGVGRTRQLGEEDRVYNAGGVFVLTR